MVSHKVAEITGRIDGLLGDGGDGGDTWEPRWKLLPAEGCRSEVLAFIITLTLTEAANWDFRFAQPFSSLPL
eukprot:4889631-Pyramimonas_sp.AAC.1